MQCTRVWEIGKVFMCTSCGNYSSSVLDLYRIQTDICTEFSYDPNVTKRVLKWSKMRTILLQLTMIFQVNQMYAKCSIS